MKTILIWYVLRSWYIDQVLFHGPYVWRTAEAATIGKSYEMYKFCLLISFHSSKPPEWVESIFPPGRGAKAVTNYRALTVR